MVYEGQWEKDFEEGNGETICVVSLSLFYVNSNELTANCTGMDCGYARRKFDLDRS